jgi:hypothetical protein
MRQEFLQVVRRLESDYAPFGKTEHDDGSDCSCACRYFVKLAGEIGNDWGVCRNPRSPRAGLLTFGHQGCTAFQAITVDRSLTDAQLRHLIGEASQILQGRRTERTEEVPVENPALLLDGGEFMYEVRTSYFPHIKGHFPTLFRLEWHDGDFTPIPLAARVGGKQRPTVKGRFPAKNGEVFKIVRENGEYSYQIPFNGTIYNLKQHGTYDLLQIGLAEIESLRPFFEIVEPEMFETIITEAKERVGHVKGWLENSQDRLDRWRRNEFWGDEKLRSKRELREMVADEERSVREAPSSITQCEAFSEWLKGIDRSNPRLKTVACPPAPERRSGKR